MPRSLNSIASAACRTCSLNPAPSSCKTLCPQSNTVLAHARSVGSMPSVSAASLGMRRSVTFRSARLPLGHFLNERTVAVAVLHQIAVEIDVHHRRCPHGLARHDPLPRSESRQPGYFSGRQVLDDPTDVSLVLGVHEAHREEAVALRERRRIDQARSLTDENRPHAELSSLGHDPAQRCHRWDLGQRAARGYERVCLLHDGENWRDLLLQRGPVLEQRLQQDRRHCALYDVLISAAVHDLELMLSGDGRRLTTGIGQGGEIDPELSTLEPLARRCHRREPLLHRRERALDDRISVPVDPRGVSDGSFLGLLEGCEKRLEVLRDGLLLLGWRLEEPCEERLL